MENSELINAYFDGELSEIEKESFIKNLDQDPILKQEFNLQSQIIEGIKSARKAELIARLDAVSIGTSGTTQRLNWGKMSVIGGVVLLGILTYYSLQNTQTETTQVAPKEVSESIDSLIPSESVLSEVDVNKSENESVSADDQKVSKPAVKAQEKVAIQKPDINKPELVEPLEIESDEESELIPESGFADESPIKLSNIDIEVDNSKKRYSFHYQIKEGKLFLFGDFDKGLYEILEFNSSEGKILYLYYKQSYYDLKQSASEITALKEISEPALINKLENVRKDIKN